VKFPVSETIDVNNATEILNEHGKDCTCSTCMYAKEHMKQCTECNKLHEKIAFCTKCKACLYENSKQVIDDMYPLFKCTKCGQVNFWD
jgi:hypothetical protein